jgi:3-oxoacyl-[acyl-carrier protein] reductase
VVTGAGSGIGRATALALAARGLDVCCAGRRLEPLQETAGQLCGGRSLVVAADVSTADGVRAIVGAVGGAPVAAVVHAAAIEGIVSLADTTRSVFDQLVAVNLAGPFFLTQALRPLLADGSGIVFVSSISALHGRPRHAAYAATKAALLGLTTSLAAELAPRVRVNCVSPGATDTPMMAEAITAYLDGMDAEEIQRTGTAEMARVLLGRVGDPAELAAAIVHLALDASYSTGSVVTVDGGYSARLPGRGTPSSRRPGRCARRCGANPACWPWPAHSGHMPNSSTVCPTSVKPASAATRSAHCSTARPSTSTLFPQLRQVRWW